MPEPIRILTVFLCYAHNDKVAVKALYDRLVNDGVFPWLDQEKLLPGQDWELVIRNAVRRSDVIVVCLSKQFNNAGFRQKEVRLALDTAMEKPEGEIFIIPARLEACETLESLKRWHWVDLFEANGYDMLMRALRAHAQRIGATLLVASSLPPKSSPLPVKRVDTRGKTPGIPSRASRKPFALRTEYLVALIAAVATIFAAVLNSPLIKSWLIQTPNSSAAVTFPTLQPGTTINHRVGIGESLFDIVRCYGANFESVLNANPQISDPKDLSNVSVINVPNIGSVGEVYGPPCVVFHAVQSGDTWESLARKYNADIVVLKESNQGSTLSAGRIIRIPWNSAPYPIRLSTLSALFKHEDDIPPNKGDCYDLNILPSQVMNFTTTTSTDLVTHVVHGPDESIVKDTGILILYGSLNGESSYYEYCIFNRSSAPIKYTLEVSLSE